MTLKNFILQTKHTNVSSLRIMQARHVVGRDTPGQWSWAVFSFVVESISTAK